MTSIQSDLKGYDPPKVDNLKARVGGPAIYPTLADVMSEWLPIPMHEWHLDGFFCSEFDGFVLQNIL